MTVLENCFSIFLPARVAPGTRDIAQKVYRALSSLDAENFNGKIWPQIHVD